MSRDPISLALSMLTRAAGSPWLDRLGLRRMAETAAFQGTRTGFQALGAANRRFQTVRAWLPRQLLPARQPGPLFDLTLDQDQQLIVDSLQRLARDTIRPAAAAAEATGEPGESILRSAADIGLSLYGIPESFGGVAEHRSPVTSVLIAEQLAWGDMGLALAMLAPFSVAQAITRWGTGDQQSRYLPAFAEPQPPQASIAMDENSALFDPWHLTCKARRCDGGFRLHGTKSGVVMGQDSELMLVAADLEGRPRLFIVDHPPSQMTCRPAPAMGLRAAGLTDLQFDQVKLPQESLLGDHDFDYQQFLDYGTLIRCALAVGTCQAVLDYVIPYCNERQAFGEPISHRQSVAFMISNMAIETDSMRLLTWRAASRAENGQAFHKEAHLARMLCAEKAMETGTNGVQLLGGHGFVKEHPVERWYRDLRSVATQVGGIHA